MRTRSGVTGILPALLLGSALAVAGGSAVAADGVVQQLAGTISVQKPDGSIRTATRQSEINKGDTLNTEKDSYAQVKFADGGVLTLKPNSRVKVEDFLFDEKQPAKDTSTLSLLKGGLRMITGLISKRGNQDAFKANTATATIGVRGTTFTVEDCFTTACVKRGGTKVGGLGMDYASAEPETMSDGAFSSDPQVFQDWVERDRAHAAVLESIRRLDAPLVAQAIGCDAANAADCVPPSVIVGVSDGEILVFNSSGAPVAFRAGQWGAISNFSARPQTLPGDPGLPIYQPPATFFQNISGTGVRNASTQCLTN